MNRAYLNFCWASIPKVSQLCGYLKYQSYAILSESVSLHLHVFPHFLQKGRIFVTFACFDEPFSEWGPLLKERLCSCRSKVFSL